MDLEEQHLHAMLEELLTNPGQPSYLIFMKSIGSLESGQQVMLMERLKHLNLVRSPAADELYLQLTPQGIDVARHAGGYLGYKRAQANQQQQAQQRQYEREALERDADIATVSSAKSAVSATRAAWVAAGFSLVGVVISIIALTQPDKTEPLQKQVTALQQQVITLQAKIDTPAQLPQTTQPKLPAISDSSSRARQKSSKRNH